MSEIIDRIVAILVGPGAACFMTKPDAESDAREILRALREPTLAMVAAAKRVDGRGDFRDEWRAAIDRALR